MSHIRNDENLPEKLKIGFDSALIKDTNLTIEQVQEVLNTSLDEKMRELKGYQKDKTQYTGAEKNTFDWVVKAFRLVNGVHIGIYWQYKDKGDHSKGYKKDLFLAIIYPKMTEEEQKEFDKLYLAYNGETTPPTTKETRSLEEPIISQMVTWTCKECWTINREGATCRACGWWKHANSQREENYSEIKQEAKVEVPPK